MSLRFYRGRGSAALCSFLPKREALGIKVVNLFKDNPARFGIPSIQALAVLLDASSGRVQCIMDANALTAIRTAAVSGLATKLLARENASTVAVIGSGVQAAAHIWAMCSVRSVKKVHVFSPHLAEKWDSFVSCVRGCTAEMLSRANSAESAVSGADIVCITTTSSEPVIKGAWISPGAHLNVIGSHSPKARELDTDTVVMSRIVCESVGSCLREAGDILIPIEEGALRREVCQHGTVWCCSWDLPCTDPGHGCYSVQEHRPRF